jgi:hypothetical protein
LLINTDASEAISTYISYAMPESDASRSEFKLIPSESTALGEVLPFPAPRYEPTTEMDYRKIAPPPGLGQPVR